MAKTGMRGPTLTEQLATLTERHGTMIATALRAYTEMQTKLAERLEAEVARLEADPAARAAQDESWVTTDGYRFTAQGVRESIERCAEALAAFEALQERVEADGR